VKEVEEVKEVKEVWEVKKKRSPESGSPDYTINDSTNQPINSFP
jgi:hypothetical protein